jgi:P27 family predicted phage terminase small subunit
MPRSNALKVLAGERSQRINLRQPEPRHGLPEAPDFLDERGRLYFDDLVEQTKPMGTLFKCDSTLLGVYCDCLSQIDRAREIARRSGLVTMDSRGAPKRHPALLIMHDAIAQAIRLSRELGLSPAVRHSLSVQAPEDGSDAGRLI